MQRTSVIGLVVVFGVVALVGWPVLRAMEANGVYLPTVPWLVDVAIVALAAAVFWLGWTVRAYQKGDRPSLDGLRAARTLVLAKAAALTGALLGGWYLAQVLLVLPDLAVEPRRDKAIAAIIAVVCAVGLSVVGLVVERFCQLPPSDGEESDANGSAATA
ncbi:DUF3180 domain-containing protein [Myceligenerans halotolerans]